MIPSIMAARFREGLKDYIVVHVILILRFIFRDKGQEFLLLLAQSYLKLYYEKRTAPVWRRPGKGDGNELEIYRDHLCRRPAGWEWRGILKLVPKLMGSPPFFPVDDWSIRRKP